MLNLNELQVFIVAAETENFSEAGRRLNLSQPAVSMQIRSLETQLNVTLFHRAGRHIRLTEAGHALVPMARDLIQRAIRLEETMASLEGEVVGLLRVGCSTTSGKYILPKLIAGLRRQHPQVQVICHVTSRSRALRMLLEGEVHVALSSLREPYKDIEYRPFLTDRIILIAPPDHPWARQKTPIEPTDLLKEDFILREEGSGTHAALKEGLACHDLSLDHLNVVMILGNSEAICMAVQEGIGLAFVSALSAAEAIQSGSLAMIEVKGLELSQTLYMAHHAARPATRAQIAFWEYAFAPENEAIRRLPSEVGV
ncbi:MAG TPA: LysR family transcriptional regulator [Chloroflexi bacterium]|nr:LysR family transcriptional regulator [Chloroflexota bacterium]